jgi:hypothetical protein
MVQMDESALEAVLATLPTSMHMSHAALICRTQDFDECMSRPSTLLANSSS